MTSPLVPAVIAALERIGIPYMITGSIAGAAHGFGRSTMDLDLVVNPDPGQLARFADALDPTEFYGRLPRTDRQIRSPD